MPSAYPKHGGVAPQIPSFGVHHVCVDDTTDNAPDTVEISAEAHSMGSEASTGHLGENGISDRLRSVSKETALNQANSRQGSG